MPPIARDASINWQDLSTDGCYRLLAAITNKALEDALISYRLYHQRSPHPGTSLRLAKDLMDFLWSEWFLDICEELGYRPDTVRAHVMLRLKDGRRPCRDEIQKTLLSRSLTA